MPRGRRRAGRGAAATQAVPLPRANGGIEAENAAGWPLFPPLKASPGEVSLPRALRPPRRTPFFKNRFSGSGSVPSALQPPSDPRPSGCRKTKTYSTERFLGLPCLSDLRGFLLWSPDSTWEGRTGSPALSALDLPVRPLRSLNLGICTGGDIQPALLRILDFSQLQFLPLAPLQVVNLPRDPNSLPQIALWLARGHLRIERVPMRTSPLPLQKWTF